VYSRFAGYEDVNDAERVSADPTFRLIGSEKAWDRGTALTSRVQSGIVANTYLEGTYTEVYPSVGRDLDGLHRLFKQFSWPYGIPSHVAPETPGSIHEGGELGYSLVHATGAVFDNPDLIAACVVGDGEAETGPCAASWHSNTFLNPIRDGVVLPILYLNGRDPLHQRASQGEPELGTSAVAHDYSSNSQRLDRAERGGRETDGGFLEVPPGTACGTGRESGAPEAS